MENEESKRRKAENHNGRLLSASLLPTSHMLITLTTFRCSKRAENVPYSEVVGGRVGQEIASE